ncbi:MAG: rod-binding protein [Candidatus Gastranaerophilales bacterium]|nr:rod-binding protein [Candidatus Gastranaerophilales bacterium]
MNNFVGNIGQSYMQNSSDLAEIEQIKRGAKSQKEQLKKVSQEFESIFISKMLNEMDKTVDKEGSLFQESKYLDNLKSFMYNDIARQIAQDPRSNLGIAKQMYTQLEKTVRE